ncbi:MAG TPA: hypothetical protein VJ485_04465 [archaeon]|jgi:hypothetical protein|nr:hypothetical protein [archaeon]
MNALKALQKKKLPRDTKVTPSLFHPKRGNKEWSDKTFYVNRIETAYSKGDSQKQGGNLGKRYQIVYVSEKPYFQGDIAGFGIALTTEKKKKYGDRDFYLGYFKVID